MFHGKGHTLRWLGQGTSDSKWERSQHTECIVLFWVQNEMLHEKFIHSVVVAMRWCSVTVPCITGGVQWASHVRGHASPPWLCSGCHQEEWSPTWSVAEGGIQLYWATAGILSAAMPDSFHVCGANTCCCHWERAPRRMHFKTLTARN